CGGSSVYRVVDGKIQVGPESVGGAPGPACFGYGGKEATITDAYLLMGILDGDSYFGGSLKLDPERAKAAIEENVAKPLGVSLDEALVKMEHAYVAKIAGAMKALGAETKDTTLLAFGGAGPMSACRIAESLGISEIIVPRMAAVFSAFGIGFSDIAHNYDAAITDTGEGGVKKLLGGMMKRAERDMFAEGFDLSECTVEKSLSYAQNGEQATRNLNGEVAVPENIRSAQDLRLQVRATKSIPHFALKTVDGKSTKEASTSQSRKVRLSADGKLAAAKELPLYRHDQLSAGQSAAGPAIVEEEYFTCLLPAGWKFLVNENHDLVLSKK
ncbi:MAG TPA: hydantoinase/oxoprolinase family protein, partial [Nevskiaceae bacterium]|nr:hydantoinase/oxoprolinase family protein [Nevskiaceae bacterium]